MKFMISYVWILVSLLNAKIVMSRICIHQYATYLILVRIYYRSSALKINVIQEKGDISKSMKTLKLGIASYGKI